MKMLHKQSVCLVTCSEYLATGFLATARRRRRSLQILITASHALPTRRSVDEARALFPNGESTRLDPRTLLLRDRVCDLLLVAIRDPLDVPSMPLSREPIEMGESCTLIHHPKGGPLRVSRGTVSLETNCFLLHTACSAAGSSGAPILNSDGTVIGVHLASNCVLMKDRSRIKVNEGALIDRVHVMLRESGLYCV